MSQYQIAVFVGSLRQDSIHRKLADAVAKLAPADFSFQHIQIGDLPIYNQDNDANPTAAVQRLKRDIAAAQGLLFLSPEYNRSVPAVLKNALDTASRPYGQNAWAGKPAGILSASPGPIGGALGQQHLRNILACLDVPALAQPEVYLQIKDGFFDDAGSIANPDSRKFLQGWMDRYVGWVKKIAG